MITPEIKAEPSVGDLLTALARNTGTLVQQEMKLAVTEMGSKVHVVAGNLGMIATGGALVHIGLLAILAAIIAGLSPMIPVWASSAVLGVVAVALGYFLIRKKVDSLGHLNAVPAETVRTLQDDKLWIKEQLR